MKVKIEIDRDDGKEECLKIRKIIDILEGTENSPGQQTLEKNIKKYYCNNKNCKKEITKDIVAFCLHEDNKSRFNGKVYCRECQATFGGGSP